MSRLTFVEPPLDSDKSESEQEDYDGSFSVHKQTEQQNKRTYEDLTNDACEILVNENVVINDLNKKKKKKKKKKKVTSSEILITTQETKSAVEATGWLASFLNKKRNNDISPPPEIAVSNEKYLAEFNSQFANDTAATAVDDEEDSVLSSGETDAFQAVLETSMANDTEVPIEEDVVLAPTVTKLSFFNLPYSISALEIIDFAQKRGYELNNVVLGFDKRKNLPSGSATAELPLTVDTATCVTALQGESCGGRPVRVVKVNPEAKRRVSGGKEGSRYFAADLSFKCQSCGEVGHKQYECTNDPIPTPCHLCAGRDHEAVHCPNITCYRCGLFGHHSRDCHNPPMSRPVVCTQCGSTTHDSRQCRDPAWSGRNSDKYDSRVEGRWIRCVSCNQFGHTMCQALPKLSHHAKGSHPDVYCPNCGEKGHHIDYPGGTSDGSNRSYFCKAPKFEAYVKYPRLLQDIDNMPHDKNNYYRDLLRYGSFNDQHLFPSLSNQFGSGGGGDNSRFNMLPSYLPGSRQGAQTNGRHSFGGYEQRDRGYDGGSNYARSSDYGGFGGGRDSDQRSDNRRNSHGGARHGQNYDYINGNNNSHNSNSYSGSGGSNSGSKKRKSYNISSESSSESESDLRHARKKNYCGEVAGNKSDKSSNGDQQLQRRSGAQQSKAEFDAKAEARKKRFSDQL